MPIKSVLTSGCVSASAKFRHHFASSRKSNISAIARAPCPLQALPLAVNWIPHRGNNMWISWRFLVLSGGSTFFAEYAPSARPRLSRKPHDWPFFEAVVIARTVGEGAHAPARPRQRSGAVLAALGAYRRDGAERLHATGGRLSALEKQ